MPWISLAAARYRFKTDVEENYLDPSHEVLEQQPVDARPGLDALISGLDRYIPRELKRSAGLLRISGAERKLVPGAVREVFGLAVLAWVGGEEVGPIVENIAGSKALRSPEAKRLQDIAKWIIDPALAPRAKEPRSGHVEGEKEWFKVVGQSSPEESLDLALTPDHGDWAVLGGFVLPLAMLVAISRGGRRETVLDLLARGPRVERRGRLLYERTQRQPEFDEEVHPDQPATWPSFAAVEIKDEELIAYHYLDISWKAPLLFEPESGLNAFSFLDHVDLAWRLVDDAATAADRQLIKGLRDQGRCRHVVAFDSAEAVVSDDDLNAAAKHYQLQLEARDLMDV
jgi:hypothetical protein